jgi:hypothetical protein
VAEPSAAAEARPTPPPAAAAPVPAAPPLVDDFASLPRIRPFTDFELDPIEDEPIYTGRRRAEEPEANGRHSHAVERPTGRRHRRADETEDADLLAKLLARESAHG